jgi:hypothetical protein
MSNPTPEIPDIPQAAEDLHQLAKESGWETRLHTGPGEDDPDNWYAVVEAIHPVSGVDYIVTWIVPGWEGRGRISKIQTAKDARAWPSPAPRYLRTLAAIRALIASVPLLREVSHGDAG